MGDEDPSSAFLSFKTTMREERRKEGKEEGRRRKNRDRKKILEYLYVSVHASCLWLSLVMSCTWKDRSALCL